jgi:ribosomal protein L17
MNSDPIDIALRNLCETRQMLERLITSSESFDYHQARIALKELQKKTEVLGRIQSELTAKKMKAPNIRVVDFRSAEAANQ